MTEQQHSRPLAGRTAVITGAASGIGAATARRLAADGARVALLARRVDRLEDLAQKIVKDGGEALAAAVDVTDSTSLDSGALQVTETYGTVDLVVAAAGIMTNKRVLEADPDNWWREIDTNFQGVLRTVHAFLPSLVSAAEAGGPADLLALSSVAGRVPFPAASVYAATKAAVDHFARNLRQEVGPLGVRVTTVAPGLVQTDMSGQQLTDPDAVQWRDRLLASNRVLSADDVADLIAYVTSRPPHVSLPDIAVIPTGQP
ncbi:SDR family oxidoreductase [Streptomyces sp. YGL11-2]|uniref:SDR family oxidoreductase n=1 Tax=Streptomyces sp. YGL11-2 TaxID=3414028 RepID=UPI003CE85FA4